MSEILSQFLTVQFLLSVIIAYSSLSTWARELPDVLVWHFVCPRQNGQSIFLSCTFEIIHIFLPVNAPPPLYPAPCYESHTLLSCHGMKTQALWKCQANHFLCICSNHVDRLVNDVRVNGMCADCACRSKLIRNGCYWWCSSRFLTVKKHLVFEWIVV